MKDLRNYIESYEINEELLKSDLDIEMIDEGLGLIKGIKDLWKTVTKDVIGKKTRAAIQAFLVTVANDKNGILLDSDKEKLIEGTKDIDKYYDDLVKIIEKYKKTPEAIKDPVFIYACLNVKEIAEEKLENLFNEKDNIKYQIKDKTKKDLKFAFKRLSYGVGNIVDDLEKIYKNAKIPQDIYKKYTSGLQLADSILDNISVEDKNAAKKARKEAEQEIKTSTLKPEQTTSSSQETPQEEKEVKKEVTNVINGNSDILGDLTKKAGIDPKKLRSYVVKQLQWVKGEDGKFQKNKTEEEIGKETILGTCVMVCGAYITQDPEAIERIAKRLNTTADELLKNI